jgi:hypothetical protein
MPCGQYCPIGSLGLHTYNFEHTECVWCGPNQLGADKRGHWEPTETGYSAWSVPEVEAQYALVTDERTE